MTIAVAWLRTLNQMPELIFAADSRYRSFGAWDCAPKLFELTGTGGVIGLSGDTETTLAIIAQIQNSINLYAPFSEGAVDITHVVGHCLKIMNNMGQEISDKKGFTDYFTNAGVKAGFVVGGYSHLHQEFKMAHIVYRSRSNAFVRKSAIRRYKSAGGKFHYIRTAAAERTKRPADSTSICIVGDYIDEFLIRLSEKVGNKVMLDMEPLEVLIDMLRSEKFSKIGGAPQVVKAYRHQHTLPIGVLWTKPNYVIGPEHSKKSVFIFGRPLMGFERTLGLVLDPDDLGQPIHPVTSIKPVFR